MATSIARAPRRPGDPYLDLIRTVHPLRPIRTLQEHERAKTALRRLAGDRRPEAIDFRKVLASIMATYEREAGHAIDTSHVSAASVVRHLLAERGQSLSGFAREIGLSQGTLSDMLNGKRQWSRSTVVKLCEHFGLSPALFLK
jgi:antitoxin component HigA of HigAB toxin-antitoxin module